MPKPVNFNTTFSREDIGAIQGLANKQPVWAVHGITVGCVVVKADTVKFGNHSSVDQSNELMNLVTPSGKTKPLERVELMALGQWTNWISQGLDDLDPLEKQSIVFLKDCLNEHGRSWFKMEMLHQISTLKTEKEGQGKKVAKALNAKDGLETLGRIIAVDMFNSNNDRFGFNSGVDQVPQGCQWNGEYLNYLANVGNIVIRQVGESYEIVGLDAFDPFSRLSGLMIPEMRNWKWAFDIFNPRYDNPKMIDIVAERCVEDLNKVIGKRKRAFISSYRLGKEAPRRLAAGLRDGARIIEQHFQNKYGKSRVGLPPGLQIRAERAGWSITSIGNTSNTQHRRLRPTGNQN
jgi:hypothetical protein